MCFSCMCSSLSSPSLQHVSHPAQHQMCTWLTSGASFTSAQGSEVVIWWEKHTGKSGLLTVPLSCCWQRLYRNKCVPDPTRLIFSLTLHTVSVPTFGYVKWNQKAAYCQPGISILQQQETNMHKQVQTECFFLLDKGKSGLIPWQWSSQISSDLQSVRRHFILPTGAWCLLMGETTSSSSVCVQWAADTSINLHPNTSH